MVQSPPADLSLTTSEGETHSLREWLTNFHLVLFCIDPYTNESAWLLETCTRIMRVFREADCRVAWLATADADGSQQFLGPLGKEFLTLCDPERKAIAALDIKRLPALVHISTDLVVRGGAEGWDPAAWRAVTDELAKVMSWGRPNVPAPGDPRPFAGTNAA